MYRDRGLIFIKNMLCPGNFLIFLTGHQKQIFIMHKRFPFMRLI